MTGQNQSITSSSGSNAYPETPSSQWQGSTKDSIGVDVQITISTRGSSVHSFGGWKPVALCRTTSGKQCSGYSTTPLDVRSVPINEIVKCVERSKLKRGGTFGGYLMVSRPRNHYFKPPIHFSMSSTIKAKGSLEACVAQVVRADHKKGMFLEKLSSMGKQNLSHVIEYRVVVKLPV